MKKLLFVIPTMRMGGAEQSLVSLLNSIDLDKYEVDLLLFEKGGDLLERIPSKICIKEVDVITQSMLLEFRKYFKKLLKTGKGSAIITRLIMMLNSKIQNVTGNKRVFNWNMAKWYIPNRTEEYDAAIGYLEGVTDCYVIDKIHAKRKIGWIHTDISRQIRSYDAEGKYYQQFDQLVIISDECKKHFLKYYSNLEHKIEVVENITNHALIVNKSTERIPETFDRGRISIVTVGRLEYEKGIDIAVKAARILLDKGYDFKWHVFGDGIQKDDIQNMIQNLKLTEYFILEGITKNPYKYMSNADIIVQSSRYEGKSIVLDEAKILGKPIVVTNYPSAKDQIQDRVTGLIVEVSPEGVAEGVKQLIEDEGRRSALSKKCMELSKDNTQYVVGRFEKLLEG